MNINNKILKKAENLLIGILISEEIPEDEWYSLSEKYDLNLSSDENDCFATIYEADEEGNVKIDDFYNVFNIKDVLFRDEWHFVINNEKDYFYTLLKLFKDVDFVEDKLTMYRGKGLYDIKRVNTKKSMFMTQWFNPFNKLKDELVEEKLGYFDEINRIIKFLELFDE